MAEALATSLETIAALKAAQRLDTVHALVRQAGERFGYKYFCIAGVPDPTERMDQHIYLDAWPKGWMAQHLEEDFCRVDPVIAALRTATEPFQWNEVHHPGASRSATRMMEIAAGHRLVDGLAIPIHTLSGSQATVSFGAESMDVDPAGKSSLHLVAIYAHLRARELKRRRLPTSLTEARLTPREVECLRWIASGKTTWEISVILSISERTVRFHVDAASLKLGAVNRPHMVAEALRRDIIN